MWDGGLIFDRPCPMTEAETAVPEPTGEAGRNLGAEQRVGKWSCRWRWPGLWAAAGPRLGWGTNGKWEVIKLGRGLA